MRSGLLVSRISALSLISLAVALGQTPNLSFSYQGVGDAAPVAITPGSTYAFPVVNIDKTESVTFTISNLGTALVMLSGFQVTGSAFSVPSTPLTIQPGGNGIVTITFAPTALGATSGTFSFQAGAGIQYSFRLTGTAAGPNLVTSYLLNGLNPPGNQTQVGDGGTIPFPSTQVGTSATATVTIQNLGTVAGTVNQVTISGATFSISGLPLLPNSLAPNGAVQFTITFTPTALGSQAGSLKIQFSGGQETINLTGTAVGSVFTYLTFNLSTNNGTPIPASGVTFPDTKTGENAPITFGVRNDGNAAGTITTVTIIGAGYTISGLVPLPVTLKPGELLTFVVTFNPPVIGANPARLLINNTLIDLTGNGLGSVLNITATIASVVTTVQNNGIIQFSNTPVGSTLQGTVTVANTGNVDTSLTTLNVTGADFSLVSTPTLPAALQAGKSLSFTLVFSPHNTGQLTGVLAINNLIINLAGIGGAPPQLPTYNFTGVGSTVGALQQPVVGLQLATPYPLDITGTLTLTFASAAFVDDPEIQFSTGGRTVNFKIPANTTTALFAQSSQVGFQSGTVAGIISLTPKFSVGAVDVTPSSPIVQMSQIALAAPQIRNVALGAVTANSFQIVITGYSTSRSVTNVTLNFTPATGGNLQTTSISVPSDTAFSTWYQSTASAAVGSQFKATVLINISSGSISAVQSVSVVASNTQGSSSPASLSLQ